MNRRDIPATAIHLRIDRLVVDAGALDAGGMPRDLAARLQDAVSARLDGARPGHPPGDGGWLDAVAGDVATRVRSTMPGTGE
ncbi:hypothetical protein [Pseudoxanthomonas sp. 10H]|uniref:hypothetical protein n=1 Tax=Pseudoxanthomonas sp. 10H TaxID=3242729 RepID=UPI00355878E2